MQINFQTKSTKTTPLEYFDKFTICDANKIKFLILKY